MDGPLPDIDEFLESQGRMSTAQQDQAEFLRKARIPVLQKQTRRQAKLNALRNWRAQLDRMPSRSTVGGKNGLPTETTRRGLWYAPGGNGQSAVLSRVYDHRAVTDTNRRDMLLYPPIAIALAARIAQVVRAFGQWAAESHDAQVRVTLRAILQPFLPRLVGDAMYCALAYGFAPFEIVWANKRIQIEVANEDAEVESAGIAAELAKFINQNGDKPTPQPIVVAKPPPKPKLITTDATVIEQIKDLDPTHVQILVDGPLQKFAGLRYQGDERQDLEPLQCYVVTHEGRFGHIFGRSTLDNVYQSWYVAIMVQQFCNRYLERKGDPPYKAWAPTIAAYDDAGQIINGIDMMVTGIDKLRSSGGIVFPYEMDQGTKEMKYGIELMDEDPRVDLFLRYIEWQVKMILWGILQPDGSIMQSSRVGSYASAQTYAELAIDLREIDLQWQESYINRYLVQRILELNFPEKMQATIQAKLRPDVKTGILKDILINLLKAPPGTLIPQLVDLRDMLRRLDVPVVGLSA